jgi:23S rRNA pseudouridine1911/1915/1917 synthase
MTDKLLEFVVNYPGERLDKLIVAQVGDDLSRVQIQALIKEGKVTVDGQQVKPGVKLKGGERIAVTIPQRAPAETVQPETIPLTILYEDAALAVIDKPAGMTVHPGDAHETGTLVSALLARYPEIAQMKVDERRAGIVHRLDKDTSGLMVIARTEAARLRLMQQFQARTVEKVYLALVEKLPATLSGRIEAPIARDPKQRKRMAVVRGGRQAVSEYEVIDRSFPDGQALLRIRLLTGRTHQIRVHLAFIGCPIVGDAVYGFRRQRVRLKRHFLHAAELAFDHPVSGERLRFQSPLPPALQQTLAELRQGK